MSDTDRQAKCMKIMEDDVERFDKAFPKFVNDLMEESEFQDLEISEATARLKEVCTCTIYNKATLKINFNHMIEIRSICYCSNSQNR